jgi:hypothetical protein
MPTKLADAVGKLNDVQSRAEKFIDDFTKKSTNFWSHFGQICEGTTELGNEVNRTGAASPSAITMQDELANLKRTARKESDDAYVLINRLTGIRREVDALRAQVDQNIRQKVGKLTASSSIEGLRGVSATLNTLSGRITTTINSPPHPKSHQMLQ